MTKVQSAKLNALLVLQTLLVASKTLVAAVPALQEAIDALIDLILEINLNLKIQASPSGAAEVKRDALIELGDAAFGVAGSVLSLAEKTKDLNLAARVDFSRSAIAAGSANAVVARCQDIIDAAAENLDSLEDHGVVAAKLNALKQKLKTYDAVRVLPRDAIGAAAAATRQLERLFPKADRLLQKRIDRLVWQFRESAPEFYDKYQTARSIVDAPTPGEDEQSKVVPNPNTTPATSTTTPTPDTKVA